MPTKHHKFQHLLWRANNHKRLTNIVPNLS